MFKKLGLSILSGVLLSFGWVDYGFAGFLFVGFVPLLFLEKNSKKIFWYSYLSFIIWNIITTWWVSNSTILGGVMAIALNALFMAIIFKLYSKIRKITTDKFALIFLVLSWISFEKLHLSWDLSWPWLTLGNGFADYHKWIQWYEYTGVFGGSIWIWVVNILFYLVVTEFYNARNKAKIIINFTSAISIISIPIVSSFYIYNNYKQSDKHPVNTLIIQPNVDSYTEKFEKSNIELLQEILILSQKNIDGKIDLIIAPETALSQSFELENLENYYSYNLINSFVKNNNSDFMIGIISKEHNGNKNDINKTQNIDYHNSALFFSDKKHSIYHKSKLVPGVEIFPFKTFLEPIIGDFMIDLGGTSSSLEGQVKREFFYSKNYKLAPIICYESIYGDFVSRYVKNGANILSIITNDGWWGNSAGHRQHLAYAKLRAIENRRFIVRSANTGISAVINEKGDILQKLEYDKKGVIKTTVFTNNKMTFYSENGDFISRISIFLTILMLLSSIVKAVKNK